jgi:hypothetical protein
LGSQSLPPASAGTSAGRSRKAPASRGEQALPGEDVLPAAAAAYLQGRVSDPFVVRTEQGVWAKAALTAKRSAAAEEGRFVRRVSHPVGAVRPPLLAQLESAWAAAMGGQEEEAPAEEEEEEGGPQLALRRGGSLVGAMRSPRGMPAKGMPTRPSGASSSQVRFQQEDEM